MRLIPVIFRSVHYCGLCHRIGTLLVYPQYRTLCLSNVLRQLKKTVDKDTHGVKRKVDAAKISDIRKLLRLAGPEKYKLLGGIGLLAVSSTVMMTVPYLLGQGIDLVLKVSSKNGHDKSDTNRSNVDLQTTSKTTKDERLQNILSNLNKYGVGLVAFFSIGALATFGRVYLMNFAGERVINRLRTRAYSSIIKQDVAFFDKSKTGELINRLSNDVWTVGYATTMNISDGLRGLVGAAGGTAMMFYVSPKLALVGLGVVPPVAVIAIVYGRYIRTITKQMNDALAEATDIAEERISNIRTVRAFGAETTEEQKYGKKIDLVLDIARRESVAKGCFFGFNMISGNLILLALLYFGGNLITTGAITMGEFSSFLLYALYVGVSMSGISSFYSELMHGVGASARLFELIERRPKIPLFGGKTLEKLSGQIEFKNVHFTYPTRKDAPILKGINLVVHPNTSIAIVGSSGSGKSTIASLLLRYYDTSKGSISVDNVDIKELNPSWLRSQMGTVSQDPILFSCSIKENIAYGLPNLNTVSLFEIEEAAKQAHAYDFVKNFPQGFDTVLGEKGMTLSGGQRQRIAIARALLRNPKILIMDEATSALDSESEHAVRETLESLMYNGDKTIIIIAHRLSTIRNADQIAVVGDGKIIEIGTYWQLMNIEDGHFKKLVQRQMVSFAENDENEEEKETATVYEELDDEDCADDESQSDHKAKFSTIDSDKK